MYQEAGSKTESDGSVQLFKGLGRCNKRKKEKVQSFQAMLSPFRLSPGAYYYYVIDDDLWVEIFKKLPIESLCRLRTVFKQWNYTISSTFFINLHHLFTCSTTPFNSKCYLHVAKWRCNILVDYADLTHKCYTLRRPLDDPPVEQQLYFPFRADRENGIKVFTFVDVIHGVVCVSYNWFTSYDCLCPSFNSIFLWNPTIHKYITLPFLWLPDKLYGIGFGYDNNMKDFKVVLVWISSGAYKVYSYREGSWTTRNIIGMKKLKSSWHFTPRNQACFVNGTIHWILREGKIYPRHATLHCKIRFSMLMFDCEREKFRRINIPEKLIEVYTSGVYLFEYMGMLAALVDMGRRSDVWVMESSTEWKKLFIIPKTENIIICDPSFDKLAPYGPGNPSNISRMRHSRVREILSDRVYEQTILLMDNPRAQSYTKQEVVTLLTQDP